MQKTPTTKETKKKDKIKKARMQVAPRKSVIQSSGQYDVTSRAVAFKMASTRNFSLQTDEKFEFLTDTLFRFLRFDGAKIPIIIESHPVFGSFFFSF